MILFVFSPFILMVVGSLEMAWWGFRERMGWEVDCECRTPRSYSPLGSSFVCDECARMWYSTHDNVCWAGWAYAPWWKRAQMRLGWEPRGRRKFEDPIVEEQLTEVPDSRILKVKEKLMSMYRRGE